MPEESKRPVEQWAAEKHTPSKWFKAAKAGQRWMVGAEITEAEFDAAVHQAQHVVLR